MKNDIIRFPTEAELPALKQKFYNMNGIPNAIGVIDGTHIYIKSPPQPFEPMFVCRKGGHSVNVQVVCDSDNKFLDVVVKWPGSTHDAYIWNACSLRAKFVTEPPSGWLLGDSGYPVEPWLLVPYEAQPTDSHRKFNLAFRKSRSVVERSIGLWKSVFRRICKSGGIIQYTPEKCFKFIMATAVLHNTRRDLNLDEDRDFEVDPDLIEPETPNTNPPDEEIMVRERGNAVRDQVRQGFFE